MTLAEQQFRARRAEESAHRVLEDAIAAIGLPPFETVALTAAANAYARAHGRRLLAEREEVPEERG